MSGPSCRAGLHLWGSRSGLPQHAVATFAQWLVGRTSGGVSSSSSGSGGASVGRAAALPSLPGAVDLNGATHLTINPRLDGLGEYTFTQLNTLLAPVAPRANETPVIMSVGDPMHQPPAFLAETIARYAEVWNKYPPMQGTADFRAAVAGWLTRRYRLPEGYVSADRHILPLAGTKEGLFLAALLAVPERKAGQRPAVLLPNPFYVCYQGGAGMSGGEPVYLDATAATGFLPDLDAIAAATLERTALFYLVSPGNPQGGCASLDYLKRVITLARKYDFVVALDECYAEIYDKTAPVGGLQACAALGGEPANVLVFHSLSKRSSAAGLRSGFVAGDAKLIAGFLRLRSYGGCQVPLPIQAAATALWSDEDHVEQNRALYRQKIDVAEDVLEGRLGFYRPPGGFFLWLDVGDGVKAAELLWREAAIRTVPGSYMARPNAAGKNPADPYIRVALVHDDATIGAALARMVRVLAA
jgi:N-succinyldiaminopimelate aminotransferase